MYELIRAVRLKEAFSKGLSHIKGIPLNMAIVELAYHFNRAYKRLNRMFKANHDEEGFDMSATEVLGKPPFKFLDLFIEIGLTIHSKEKVAEVYRRKLDDCLATEDAPFANVTALMLTLDYFVEKKFFNNSSAVPFEYNHYKSLM